MGLSLARSIIKQEMAGGTLGNGSDGAVLPPLRVVSVGGGAGTDVAGMLWVSHFFLRSRPIDAVVLGEPPGPATFAIAWVARVFAASVYFGYAQAVILKP